MDKIILLIVTFISISTYANDGSKLWMGKMNLDVARKVTVKHVDGLGEGFNIEATSPEQVVVQASTPQGGAYGRMAVARLTACGRIGKGMQPLSVKETPAFKYRILNHWDNLDGSIERGYAGRSIFWSSRMKGEAWKARIRAYGLANLSVGINGCVLNNVNASPKVLTHAYIDTVRMIANILRPYYIKVYLSVNFGSPLALGATKTADPLNADVIRWWRLEGEGNLQGGARLRRLPRQS
jgi:alpha-glucuronidase